MLKCIAVDDEPLALRLLEDNISKVPYLQLIASCRHVFDAMKVLQEEQIDLIFIDIQMPGLTGLQFVGSLEKKPLVIFVTAYKQYALESYDLAVVDYLVKPVTVERFIKACNRAKELHALKEVRQAASDTFTKDYFFVAVDYSQIKVMVNDIRYIEGLRDYVKIHLRSTKTPLLVRTSLKALEPELPPAKFIRIHKSYIIAVESITAVRKNSIFLDELELPVGETFKGEVENLINRKR